jgi:preprotein translocase subunit SecF
MSTASIAISPAERQRSPLIRLYRGQTRFDFVRKRRWWFAASSLVILAGLISLGVKGLNYSIEFVGGTSWEVPAPGVTVAQAQSALSPLGFGGATITQLGSGSKAS